MTGDSQGPQGQHGHQDATAAPSATYAEDLALAMTMADTADALTMERFEAGDLKIESKPDFTPVTDADTAVEKEIRSILATHRPEDAVLGEEFGGDLLVTPEDAGASASKSSDSDSPVRQWVIDPIDGTKNFVRGVPVWATLISLLVDGVPVLGVVSAPALCRRWWASEGAGAWRSFSPNCSDTAPSSQARQLHTSGVSKVSDASIAISSLSGWADCGLRDELIDLTDRAWRLRGYGDFWSYMLVAEGAVDIAAEPEVNLWDLAALVPIVEEAGGTFTSVEGEPGPHNGSAVATNGHLHAETLDALEKQQNASEQDR